MYYVIHHYVKKKKEKIRPYIVGNNIMNRYVKKKKEKIRPYIVSNNIMNRKNNTNTKFLLPRKIYLNDQFQLKLYKPSIIVRYRGTKHKKMNNGNTIFVKFFYTLDWR